MNFRLVLSKLLPTYPDELLERFLLKVLQLTRSKLATRSRKNLQKE